jgi:hypothetical protein
MNIWSRIKLLSVRQLLRLSAVFIQKPLLILPTIKATNETIKICDSLYGKEHHKSNAANAFRHALWNFILCSKTNKILKNEDKSAIWTEKVTNLYEKVTKNPIFDQVMDLHNNRIGRDLYLSKKDQKQEEIINLLQEMVKKANKFTKIEEIQNYENELVFFRE